MIFDSSFLCIIAILVLIFILTYTTLKKRFTFKQNLATFFFCVYYTYLINYWNFPLMTNSYTTRKYWSIVPFNNLYSYYIEQSDLFYTIIKFSIIPIALSVILGVVVALLVYSSKKYILFISGVFIVELIGFVQMLYGYTIFKAFDSSIVIVQLVLYFSSHYVTKYIKKNLIDSGDLKWIT